MKVSELIDSYNESVNGLYEYFGYKEQWHVYAIDDRREYFWKIVGDEVVFHEDEALNEDDSYNDDIIGIYQADEYTMLHVDTHTDGNIFLAIYDNKKRRYESLRTNRGVEEV